MKIVKWKQDWVIVIIYLFTSLLSTIHTNTQKINNVLFQNGLSRDHGSEKFRLCACLRGNHFWLANWPPEEKPCCVQSVQWAEDGRPFHGHMGCIRDQMGILRNDS